MLYRTDQPFLFTLFLLLFSATNATNSQPLIFCRIQGSYQNMEFVDAPPLNCFRKEISLQLSPQSHLSFNPDALLSSDDFPVHEFLDLPLDDDHQFVHQYETPDPQHDGHDDDTSLSLSLSVSAHHLRRDSIVSDLNISAAELANLEWLSHFVEDSFSPAVVDKPEKSGSVSPPEPCFKSHIPVKPRTKRTRTGGRGRLWCLASQSLTDSSSSSTSSSSSSSPASPRLCSEAQILVSRKKPKRKLPSEKGRIVPGGQLPRRCSHCGVQKTPQWRTGPLGAKTLCNACGVRYKSGRLLPEYRPACSPTFSTELHSNHHRKVLQMRRGKETTATPHFLTEENKTANPN